MIRIFLAGLYGMLKEMEANLGNCSLADLHTIKTVLRRVEARCEQIIEKIDTLVSEDELTATLKIEPEQQVDLKNIEKPTPPPIPLKNTKSKTARGKAQKIKKAK